MIDHSLKLFYGNWSTIYQCSQMQNHCFLYFQTYFRYSLQTLSYKDISSFFCFATNHRSIIFTF